MVTLIRITGRLIDNFQILCRDEIGELEKDLVRSLQEIISLSMGKKLLQKSVNDWNRSMVLDLIRHQFQE